MKQGTRCDRLLLLLLVVLLAGVANVVNAVIPPIIAPGAPPKVTTTSTSSGEGDSTGDGGGNDGTMRDGGKAKANLFGDGGGFLGASTGGMRGTSLDNNGGAAAGGSGTDDITAVASGGGDATKSAPTSNTMRDGGKAKGLFSVQEALNAEGGAGETNKQANFGVGGGAGGGKPRQSMFNLGAQSNIRPGGNNIPNSNPAAARTTGDSASSAEEGEGDDFRVNVGSISFRAICTPGTYLGQSVFRPLRMDCPAVGESKVVELTFDTPNPNHGLSWSVAASYGPNRDQSQGLELEIHADGNFVQQELTSTELWKCSSALYTGRTNLDNKDDDPNHHKMCTSTVIGHNAVGEAAISVTGTIKLTNTGEGEGNCEGQEVYLEAALDDADPKNNMNTHECTQRMKELEDVDPATIIPPKDPPKDQVNPKILILKSSYAFKDGMARNPTDEEVKALLCRSEPFFQNLLRNKLSYIDGIHSYGHLLNYKYEAPPNNTTFAVDFWFIAKVYVGPEEDGVVVDPSEIVKLFDPSLGPPVAQEQIQHYVTNFVRNTNDANDVFVGAWGWKMKTAWKRLDTIVEEGIHPQFNLPLERTCPEPTEEPADPETPPAVSEESRQMLMGSTPTKDELCTVRSDITGRPRKYFQPLLLPCPAVGTQVVASMAHTMNFMPKADAATFQPDIELVATAAYGEELAQSDGMRLRVRWEPIAEASDGTSGSSVASTDEDEDCPVDTSDFDDFLSSQITTGHSIDYDHDAPIPHQVLLQIWNEDATDCVGSTIQLEVSMYEPEGLFDEFVVAPPSNSYAAATCLEPFQLDTRCISDDDGSSNSKEEPEDGSDTDDEICIYATGKDFMGRSTVAKVYPELYVDCPAQGEDVAIGFAFVMPEISNQEIAQVEITMALAHGDSLDQTDGIVLELVEGIERCDWAPGLRGSNNNRCPDWFGGEDANKYCSSFSHYESPGDQVHYTAFVKNPNGDCQGRVRIEVAIDDRGINYDGASRCKETTEVVQCDMYPPVMPQRGNTGFQLIPDSGGNHNDGDGTENEGRSDEEGENTSGEDNRGPDIGRNPTFNLGGILNGDGGGDGSDPAAQDDSNAAAASGNGDTPLVSGGSDPIPNPNNAGGDGSPNTGTGSRDPNAGGGSDNIGGEDSTNGSPSGQDGGEGEPDQPGDRPWSEGDGGGDGANSGGEGGPGSNPNEDIFRDGDTFESQQNSSGRRAMMTLSGLLAGSSVLLVSCLAL